jgi:hypothetical protein
MFYLMVNLVGFVEDNPDFVLVTVNGLDRTAKFIGDVQLVGVEQQDDSKNN